jgi:aspartyl-tRNA(Asn)/glutamyl-tRNA(Gln) amidotransferase subunit B
MTTFETVIGLEIHAQVSSKTKMFCGCDNDSFGKEANTNVCPICMGFPGTLPVTNQIAIEKGLKAAMALGCKITPHARFDRKNYFYPDLPCGYQISQFDQPVSEKGAIEITLEEGKKTINITRLHLENDAGKNTHTGTSTLLDYNRAGTPLMEIVSDPDLRNAKEAKAYAEAVQKILRYVGSSDCDMEKGMMRFDASVSIRPMGDTNLNPRAEIKNLNSFRSLEAAINFEVKRQIELWEKGTPLTGEETVGWDDNRGTTQVLRSKESAADYRYFPEPDLTPIEISEDLLEKWRAEIPESPAVKYERFTTEFGLSEMDATFYTENRHLAELFETVAKATGNIKATSSFIGTVLVKQLKDKGIRIEDSPVSESQLIQLIQMIDKAEISNNIAKTEIFEEMMTSGKMPEVIVEEKGLKQVSDTSAIEEFCKEAISSNEKAATDVRSGEMKAIGALVGYVMKQSKGKANPKVVNQILIKLLS